KEGEQDFRTQLLRVKAANPDALFLNAAAVDTLGALVKQISELQLKLPLYSFAYAAADSFSENFGSYAKGLVYVGPPDLADGSEQVGGLLREFQTDYGKSPNVPFVAATAFDGATALVSAIDASRDSSQEVLDRLNTYDEEGVLGRIRFDSDGEIEGLHYVVRQIP
ncbi:MAG: ABC transporter substrate-binding protein, partial [Bdellovibrionales bacterium]|nr:ABC transporter substrate-binding protein [Bdellovibrionales bacterium]